MIDKQLTDWTYLKQNQNSGHMAEGGSGNHPC